MYCRKCGSKIGESAKYCDSCGELVVRIEEKSYARRYEEEKNKNVMPKEKRDAILKKNNLKNPYVIPAMMTSVLAFVLGVFPWPPAWNVGTSLWFTIVIMLVALLAAYHSVKATQVNRLFDKKYSIKISPKMVSFATVLSTLTIIADTFVLVNII